MPNKPAAKKYYRASQRRRMQNKPIRTRARATVRDAFVAIEQEDWAAAEEKVRIAVTALDRATQKGVIHANNAARRKSRLLRRFHTAQTPEKPLRSHVRPPAPVEVS